MNQPLTVEQIKNLKPGDWLWIQVKDREGFYAEKSAASDGMHLCVHYGNTALWLEYEDCGKDKRLGWFAWKNKEQAESSSDVYEFANKLIDVCDRQIKHFDKLYDESFGKVDAKFRLGYNDRRNEWCEMKREINKLLGGKR